MVTSPPVHGPARGGGGNDADQVFRSLAVSPSTTETVYVGSEGNGIFKSSDGGNTWQWLRHGLNYIPSNYSSYPEIWEIAIDPNNENNLYIATVGGGPGPFDGNYPSNNGGPYKSTDGGQTWVQNHSNLPNASTAAILVDQAATNNLFLSVTSGQTSFGLPGHYGGGIYKSLDSGSSWSAVFETPANLDQQYWQILPYRPAAGRYFICGWGTTEASSLGIYRTDNSGANWTGLSGPGGDEPLIFISSASNDASYLVGVKPDTFHFYRTVNSGASWETIYYTQANGIFKISPHNDTVLYAGGNQLYKSTLADLASQTVVLTAESDNSFNDIEYTIDKNTIYAAARGYLIYKSTDEGNSWVLKANLRGWLDAQP